MHNHRFTVCRQYREPLPGQLAWLDSRNAAPMGMGPEFRGRGDFGISDGGRVVWENSDVRKSGRKNVQKMYKFYKISSPI